MNIHEKRLHARKRMRAATKKISRLKTVYGTQLSGTDLDPRVSVKHLNKLNGRQVDALVRRLDKFMERSNQFVPDARGRVMSAKPYRQYVNAVRRYNRRVQARQTRYANVFLDSAGMTVAQRRAMRKPVHPHMHDPVVNAPMQLKVSKPTNFASRKGLETVLEGMERRLKPDYDRERIAANRGTLKQILDVIGDDRIDDLIGDLSDEQFDFLWNETAFLDDVSLKYDMAMATVAGDSKSWHSDIILDSIGDISTMVSDAKKV